MKMKMNKYILSATLLTLITLATTMVLADDNQSDKRPSRIFTVELTTRNTNIPKPRAIVSHDQVIILEKCQTSTGACNYLKLRYLQVPETGSCFLMIEQRGKHDVIKSVKIENVSCAKLNSSEFDRLDL